VLLTPIFGVDDDMRGFAERYSARGYVVVAPDLFAGILPGPLPRTEEGRLKAVERKHAVQADRMRVEVARAAAELREHPDCNGKVGAIGICFGGRYAVLAAADGAVDAAGAYHATEVGLHLGELARIGVPLSLHYGERDPLAPMVEVEAIRSALRDKPEAEVCVYPDAQHSFSIPGNPSYDTAAAQAAEARVFAMLDRLK
jgi:carboxymethylenebutenolidase